MKVIVHEQAKAQVENMLRTLSGSFIFHGPAHIGKYTMALEVSRRLNCLGDTTGPCRACVQHAGGNYPDLLLLRPDGKLHITVEDVRQLISSLHHSVYYSNSIRVVVIDEADKLTVDAQNALLKVLEEPPAQTIFILVTDRPKALLPTIHSRCAEIYFPRLKHGEVTAYLVSQVGLKQDDADTIAKLSDGAIGSAAALAASTELLSARQQLSENADQLWQKTMFDRLLLAKRLTDARADIARFSNLLHAYLIAQSRTEESYIPDLPHRIEALERFRRALERNVAPRVALERLMLEM